jgi:hypothetical protein
MKTHGGGHADQRAFRHPNVLAILLHDLSERSRLGGLRVYLSQDHVLRPVEMQLDKL